MTTRESNDPSGGVNELLVWNAADGSCDQTPGDGDGPSACAKQNGMLPPNVTEPKQASVVMRKAA